MPDYLEHVETFKRIISANNLVRYDPRSSDPDSLETAKLIAIRGRSEMLIEQHRNVPGAKMPPVHFDYIDFPGINAMAAFNPDDRCGYIGVCTGTVYLLYDLFYRMLSHPSVLPRIGDSSIEAVHKPFHSQGISQDYNVTLKQRIPYGGRLADVQPKDPHRLLYANELASYALDFLILHELCHIRHGHCQLANAHGIHFISELNLDLLARNAALTTDECMMFQAMEMDADSYAALATFKLHANSIDQVKQMVRVVIDKGPPDGWPQNAVPTRELFLHDWSFAISAMFWMFGLRFDPNKIESQTHPPAPQRSLNAGGLIVNVVEVNGTPSDGDAVARVCAFAFGGVKNAMAMISDGIIPPELHNIGKAISAGGVFSQHLGRLKAKWTEIRAELLQFSYVVNLAP